MSSTESSIDPRIYNSALKLLGRRAHGTEELRRKLRKKGDPEEVDRVISELQRKRYLDDREFAYFRARSLCLNRHWGRLRISLDLKNLGVDDKIIEDSLTRAKEEVPEEESLQKVIGVYLKLHGNPASVKDVKKLFDRCIRLGYHPEMVRDRLNTVFASISWD